jgi:hypothetical protein
VLSAQLDPISPRVVADIAQSRRRFSKHGLECASSGNSGCQINVSTQLEFEGNRRLNPRHDHYFFVEPYDQTKGNDQVTAADVMDEFVSGLVRRRQGHTQESRHFRFELANDIMEAIVSFWFY